MPAARSAWPQNGSLNDRKNGSYYGSTDIIVFLLRKHGKGKLMRHAFAFMLSLFSLHALAAGAVLQGPEVEVLRKMNENNVRAWLQHDQEWYRNNLAEHFVSIVGDGSVLSKADFLAH